MSDFAEIYEDIMEKSIVTKPKCDFDNFYFELSEDEPNAKLKKVVINNVPRNSILVNLQFIQGKQVVEKLKVLFNESRNFFKLCDYLLIAKEKHSSSNKPYLHFIFIELKSEKLNNKHILEQFRGASSFNRYIEAILEYNWNFIAKETCNICISYTLFHCNKAIGSREKRRTPKRIIQKPESIDNVKKLSAKDNLTFEFMSVL